jgi:hypothetical protein
MLHNKIMFNHDMMSLNIKEGLPLGPEAAARQRALDDLKILLMLDDDDAGTAKVHP